MDIICNNAAVRCASGAAYGGSAYDFIDPLASAAASAAAAIDSWTWAPVTQMAGSCRASEADCSGVLYGCNAVNGWRTDPVIATSRTRKPDRATGERKKEVAFDAFEEILEDAS